MKTTDYPKHIEKDIAQHVLPLAEKYRLACEDCRHIEKSIAQQQDAVDTVQARLDELKSTTGLRDAEAIQKQMREKAKAEDELKMAERTLAALKNEVLPPSVKARDDARAVCGFKILELMRQKRIEADNQVNAILRAAISEQDAFIQAFSDVANRCGVSLPLNDETLRPGILTGADISDIESRLLVREERERIKTSRQENSQATQSAQPAAETVQEAAPSNTLLTGVAEQEDCVVKNED